MPVASREIMHMFCAVWSVVTVQRSSVQVGQGKLMLSAASSVVTSGQVVNRCGMWAVARNCQGRTQVEHKSNISRTFVGYKCSTYVRLMFDLCSTCARRVLDSLDRLVVDG